MTEYRVAATRWEEGWELHIEGVGVTQVSTLAAVERTVRSYLRLDGHKDAATATICLEFPEHAGEVAKVQSLQAQADTAVERAAEASRTLVTDLARSGLNGAEIATVMQVSPQRVSQLRHAARPQPTLPSPSSPITRTKPAVEISERA